jgi:hypothetical protein
MVRIRETAVLEYALALQLGEQCGYERWIDLGLEQIRVLSLRRRSPDDTTAGPYGDLEGSTLLADASDVVDGDCGLACVRTAV